MFYNRDDLPAAVRKTHRIDLSNEKKKPDVSLSPLPLCLSLCPLAPSSASPSRPIPPYPAPPTPSHPLPPPPTLVPSLSLPVARSFAPSLSPTLALPLFYHSSPLFPLLPSAFVENGRASPCDVRWL